MSDITRKAEKLTFICNNKWNYEPITNGYLVSIRSMSKIALFSLVIQEVLFYVFGLPSSCIRSFEAQFYIFLLSIVRIVVFVKAYKAICANDFGACYKHYKNLRRLTILQLVNIAAMTILRPYLIVFDIVILTPVILNIYSLYVLFSFTKYLGLGNLEIIDSNPPPIAVPLSMSNNTTELLNQPVTDYRNIVNNATSLVIGAQNEVSDINDINSHSMIVLEKIALTSSIDISFAQSAQNAIVNDLVLPSGVRVPTGKHGMCWRIAGTDIILS
jgi:hypothetical protein